jgi:glycosyltransferase involved in cell wall biosynthesis
MTDISVLTPSYGYARFIEDAIKSVVDQTGVSADHVIQDGGSTDGTIDVLRQFTDRVDWRSEPDDGQSDALNRALSRATGRWVTWLNADKFYLPGGLSALLTEGDRSDVDVVYGDSIELDVSGQMVRLRPAHPFSPPVLRWYGPFINSTSFMVRRDVLGDDPWDPTLKIVMDWDLYLGLLQKGARFRYVSRPVGAYRKHELQASAAPGTGQGRWVRQRYDLPASRWCRRTGLMMHRLHKLQAGSYRRQARARAFQGRGLRWFDDDRSAEIFRALMHRCYGSSTADPA